MGEPMPEGAVRQRRLPCVQLPGVQDQGSPGTQPGQLPELPAQPPLRQQAQAPAPERHRRGAPPATGGGHSQRSFLQLVGPPGPGRGTQDRQGRAARVVPEAEVGQLPARSPRRPPGGSTPAPGSPGSSVPVMSSRTLPPPLELRPEGRPVRTGRPAGACSHGDRCGAPAPRSRAGPRDGAGPGPPGRTRWPWPQGPRRAPGSVPWPGAAGTRSGPGPGGRRRADSRAGTSPPSRWREEG